MKRCSYCGNEYADDATVCCIDGEPLVAFPLQPPPPEQPEQKISEDYTPKSLRFLCRPLGVLIPIVTFVALGYLLYVVSQLAPDKLEAGFFYFVCGGFLPPLALIATAGMLKILRGERNLKRMLIHIGWGFGLMPLSLVMPFPFFLFVPFGVLALVYGTGGCIGCSIVRIIQNRRRSPGP